MCPKNRLSVMPWRSVVFFVRLNARDAGNFISWEEKSNPFLSVCQIKRTTFSRLRAFNMTNVRLTCQLTINTFVHKKLKRTQKRKTKKTRTQRITALHNAVIRWVLCLIFIAFMPFMVKCIFFCLLCFLWIKMFLIWKKDFSVFPRLRDVSWR